MKYQVISRGNKWVILKEGWKRAFRTNLDKSKAITEAVYESADNGGKIFVHNKDGTIDFVIDCWD
jgi:hypothetical protein